MISENKFLNNLIKHYSFSREESKSLMDLFINAKFSKQIASAILSVMSFKGETTDELMGFVDSLKENTETINLKNKNNIIDITGIQGETKNTFNISTVSSLVMSCLGVKIIKQIKSLAPEGTGSLDFLEALGIKTDASSQKLDKVLKEENYSFINIKESFPLLGQIKEVEKKLGIPTIISMLPPICHPAGIEKIIIGTEDRPKASLIASVIEKLDILKAYILWNDEGYDEIVPIGTTNIMVVEKGSETKEIALTASSFNLNGNYKKTTKIPSGKLKESINIIDEVDSCKSSIIFDTIAMNVILGLKISGIVKSLKEGSIFLKENFKPGMLKQKIENLKEKTN
jgi:anthranilate phosphoribosyltransferase